MGQIIQNAIKTPDGTILVSHNRHDYKEHEDTTNGLYYMVDGGLDYIRRSNTDNAEDLTVYEEEPFEEIRLKYLRGGYGKDGTEPLTYTRLCDMDDEYLTAAIEYNTKMGFKNSLSTKLYAQELDFRQRKQLQDMETKRFKHQKTGKIFQSIAPGVYTENGATDGVRVEGILPGWLVENSAEWTKMFQYKEGTAFKVPGSETIFTIAKIAGGIVDISWNGGSRSANSYPEKVVDGYFEKGSWKPVEVLFVAEDGYPVVEGDSWYYVVHDNPEYGIKRSSTLVYRGTSTSKVSRFVTEKAAKEFLKSLQKPLFKSIDGDEIFEGDKYWVVNTSTWSKPWERTAESRTHIAATWRLFTSEEKAAEFYVMNRPCLSINEIASVYVTANQYNKYKESFSSQGEKLRKMVIRKS